MMIKNKLLVAAAVAALTAGSGLALAQGSADQKAPAQKAPAAEKSAPSGGMKSTTGAAENKGAMEQKQKAPASAQKADDKAGAPKKAEEKSAPKGGQTTGQAPAQNQPQKSGQSSQQPAQQKSTTTQQKGTTGQAPTTTQPRQGQGTTSQQPGTQGQAGGSASTSTSVQISTEQRTRIQQVLVKERNAPRVTNVDFALAVGTVVPRGKVKFVPLPRTVLEIYPAWRGYDYFLVGDEIVVVDPRTLRIVAVLPA